MTDTLNGDYFATRDEAISFYKSSFKTHNQYLNEELNNKREDKHN